MAASGGVPTDKTCDRKAYRTQIGCIGAAAVIHSNWTRKLPVPHDATAYKRSNRIEHHRRIAQAGRFNSQGLSTSQ